MNQDIVVFNSFRDVEDKILWFDRMYVVIAEEIRVLNICLSKERGEGEYSNVIIEPNDSIPDSILETESTALPPLVLTAFSSSGSDKIVELDKILETIIENRVKILNSVDIARKRMKTLKMDVYFRGRAVVMLFDPIWRVLGYKYLFHPKDATEFFCTKGKCSTMGMFTIPDPYFKLVSGAFSGSLVSTVSAW